MGIILLKQVLFRPREADRSKAFSSGDGGERGPFANAKRGERTSFFDTALLNQGGEEWN